MPDLPVMNEDNIVDRIIYIRGQKVMLDTDLADLYGVKTKRLNEQVKRNISRFPADFMFRLTDKEVEEVVAICDHLQKLKFSHTNPYAFTEHGAIMLASVLNTSTAIETSVFIVRAFVKMREFLFTYKELENKIKALENKQTENFSIIYTALEQLIQKESEPRKRIGYKINKT